MSNENTVPQKLIQRYNNLIQKIGEKYQQSKFYKKSYKKSGAYLDAQDYSHYFSFHPSITKIQGNKEIIVPHRIHLKINGMRPQLVIELKIDEESFRLVPKTDSVKNFKEYIVDKNYKVILDEIEKISNFIIEFSKENKVKVIDYDKPPPAMDTILLMNKYKKYKLKYLILKNLILK